MSTDPNRITLKTAVNTRQPLSERAGPLREQRRLEESVTARSALHRSVYTTYDAAYNSVPARTDPSAGNRYLTLLRSKRTAASVKAVGTGKTGGGAGIPDSTFGGDKSNTVGFSSEIHSAEGEKAPSQSNGKPQDSRKSQSWEPVVTRYLPAEWETEQQASSRFVLPVVSHDFYSTARKIEQEDDDRRSGLVGNTQRTVDIMRKRANYPPLCPPKEVYRTFRPVRPPRDTDENGRPARYCLDIVDCTQLAPPTEEQLGFDTGPIGRLPDADSLSQALNVQQRIITDMGTSNPLFAGTAKVMKTAIPNYVGHVPTHPKNVAAQHGNDTDPLRLWSKSFMTLAEHGGGVDSRTLCRNPLVRSRRGAHAPQAKELSPKSVAAICRTVEGSMLQATLRDTLPAERVMNRREDKEINWFA